jgi:hypothetical protein
VVIRDVLKEAAEQVEAAGIPEDLRPAAFAKAVDLLAAQAPRSPNEPTEHHSTTEGSDGVSGIARRLKVSTEEVSEVFEIVDDDVRLIVAPSVLPKQRAAATRAIALLIAAARQSAGVDDGWTNQDVLRDHCREFGVLDSANFASEIGGMGDYFGLKGSGRSRKIRVNLRGLEEAGNKVRELAGRQAT